MGFKQRILPYLALGVGILSLSFSALFARWANAPGPVIAFYRISIATLVLAPAFLWRRRVARRRAAKKLVSLGWGILIFPFLGGIFTALDHAVWNTAVNNTTAANATLLGNTAPLWVALASWLIFHEHLTHLFWIGLAFALGGAAVVLGTDFLYHPTFGWGDVLALLAGFFYACYFLVTQLGRQKLDTLSYIWLVDLTSSLFLLAICVLLGISLIGYPPQTYLAFLGAALVPQVIGYLAIAYALGHLPASVVSPTMILQPMLTAFLAIPLLGEMLQPAQWLGGLAVLAGIYMVHYSREAGKQPKRDAEETPRTA